MRRFKNPAAQYQVGGGTCKKFRKQILNAMNNLVVIGKLVMAAKHLISEDVAPVVEEEGLTAAQKNKEKNMFLE